MSTPHNQANMGEIAKVVLMPGDPLRAKFIAETFLDDVVQFNSVRNMYGFTGTYKGVKVSVMGSGMGMPSIGIYSYELYSQYGVDTIIRIGSAGSYLEDVKVYDVVCASGAYSQSNYAKTMSKDNDDVQYPSKLVNEKIIESAKELGVKVHEKIIHSSDNFYYTCDDPDRTKRLKELDCACVEMESFALFHNAKVLNKNAACLLTISDSLVTHEETTAEERQSSFTTMMKIALEAAIKL